jgi:hypothetical protein
VARPTPYQISKDELRREIVAYQDHIRLAAQQRAWRHRHGATPATPRGSRCSERLGELLLLLANRLAERPNFRGYSFKEDMISTACISMLHGCEMFDLSRGTSPFAYLTQCAWWAFTGVIRREAKRGFKGPDGFKVELEAMEPMVLGNFPQSGPEARLPARGSYRSVEA